MIKILTYLSLIILAVSSTGSAHPSFCNSTSFLNTQPYKLYVSGALGKSHILGSADKTKFLEHAGATILRAAVGIFHPTHEAIYSRLEVEAAFVNFKNSRVIFPGVSDTKNRHYKNSKIATLMPSIYIGWHAHDIVKPYIGMGVGYARMKHISYVEEEGKYMEYVLKSESESNIAAQVIIGSAFKINENLSITIDHRRIKHNGIPCKSYNLGIIYLL